LFKLAATQEWPEAVRNLEDLLETDLFPPGTKVKLAGLKAAFLNGLCGSVPTVGRWTMGKVPVLLDNGREQAIPYENLECVQ
jgi:hypothetical protein